MKRLAFYVFWEKDGIVRDYVTYYLRELKKVAEDILVIANGGVNVEGAQKLKDIGVELLQRENHGIDFGAWKVAFEYKGWDKVESYDQLILCNCSTYGPIYPFQDMFDGMEKRICDFWGITKHPAADFNFISDNPETVILEHIQSYFIVFNNNVLKHNVFHDWWFKLVPTDKYEEEVGLHETKFTDYLEKNGFKSDTYVPAEKYYKLVPFGNVMGVFPDKVLIEDYSPLIKRKVFVQYLSDCGERFSNGVLNIKKTILDNTDYSFEYIKRDFEESVCKVNLFNKKKYQILSFLMPGRRGRHYRKKYFYQVKLEKLIS